MTKSHNAMSNHPVGIQTLKGEGENIHD